MNNILKKLQQSHIKYKEQELLAKYTTFKIGGPSDLVVFPKTMDEMVIIAKVIIEEQTPYEIIGGGSNLLVSDEGFRGLVIIPHFLSIIGNENSICVGASVGLQQLLQFCLEHCLGGLEYLVGIPGSVGGALAGNAGTSTLWIGSAVSSVIVINMRTAQKEIFPKERCAYAYRSSIFKNSQERLIIEGNFTLTHKPVSEIQNTMKQYISRRGIQPAGGSSAGCVFKNPPEIPAGKLIDELGLKGKSIGKVQISVDHGNFMLNTGGAHATDVIKLISYVKQQARDKRGIQLQEEIRYIGF
jgi:UDP-N-acetylmuramate dehydrogenase